MFECTMLALALVQANDIRGAEIFPETTFFVAQIENIPDMLERMGESRAWEILGDGETLEQKLAPMYDEMAESLDLEQDQVGPPDRVGLSGYVAFDEDLGIEVPAYLAYVDFKKHEKMAKAIFDSALDSLVDDAEVHFDQEEMRGREMIVIQSEFEMPALGEVFDGADMLLPMEGGEMWESLSTVYIIRDGGRLLIGSDPVGLDDALAVIDGGKAKVLADNANYQSMRDMIPAQGRDLNAMILTNTMQPIVAPILGGPMTAGVLPLLQELFGDLRGYGFWADVARGSNICEAGLSILIEGDRRGLIKLLDVSRPAGEIPTYVPSEATSYSRIDFDFKNIIPTMRQVIGSLPEAQAQEIEPMFEQFAPILQSGLETLGPEIHIFTVQTDSPFTPTRTTFAIPTSNAEALEQMFAMMAPAGGLMPRDFNGNTIYADPLDEFNRTAIGIGAGSLVIGESDGVEAVLRSAGQKDLPRMDRSEVVRRVGRSLPSGDLMGWGVIDIVKQAAAQQAMAAMMPMLLSQAGVDAGAVQDEMERVMKIDEEQIKEMFGPGWWYMKSDDHGFSVRGGIMNPNN